MQNKALRALRSGKNLHRLRQYREDIMSTHAYRATGIGAWKYGGSSQERIVELLEQRGMYKAELQQTIERIEQMRADRTNKC